MYSWAPGPGLGQGCRSSTAILAAVDVGVVVIPLEILKISLSPSSFVRSRWYCSRNCPHDFSCTKCSANQKSEIKLGTIRKLCVAFVDKEKMFNC